MNNYHHKAPTRPKQKCLRSKLITSLVGMLPDHPGCCHLESDGNKPELKTIQEDSKNMQNKVDKTRK